MFMEIILWIAKTYVVYKVYEIMIEKEYLPLVVMPAVAHCTLLMVDHMFWMMPYRIILPFVISVHSLINTWTFIIFGITIWIIIEYLYVKCLRVRIFVNTYRKYLYRALILLLILYIYVTIIRFTKDNNAKCLPVNPYDYFMHSYRLQARYKFWQNFYYAFLSSWLIIVLSICFYFLMVPISIA